MHLSKWHLVFYVSPQEDEDIAWESLDQQITYHLEQKHIRLIHPPEREGLAYFNLAWLLCPPGKASKVSAINYAPVMPPHYSLTWEHVRAIARHDPIEKGVSTFFVG